MEAWLPLPFVGRSITCGFVHRPQPVPRRNANRSESV